MKVIAICNTALQIISALNLKCKFFANDAFDVVISDHMNNSINIVNNANIYKVFDNTFYAETFELCRRKKVLFSSGIKGKYQRAFLREKLLSEIIDIEKYDIMLFNNFDEFNRLLYQVLYRKNKNLKAYIIEDGYSSYYAQGWEWENIYKQSNGIKYNIKKFYSAK